MPTNENVFRILWQKIQGSYRHSIQQGDYQGLVTAVAVKGGRLVLASLSMGIAGELLEPISDYFIKKTVGVLWESAAKVVSVVNRSANAIGSPAKDPTNCGLSSEQPNAS